MAILIFVHNQNDKLLASGFILTIFGSYLFIFHSKCVYISGYNTLDSRKTPKQKRYIRKGSVGPTGSSSSSKYTLE